MQTGSTEASSSSTAVRFLPWLFAIPVVPFILLLVRWSNNYYADDSYFYFQVAYNIAHGLGSTFNGVMPTNGYHPLWMVVCVAVFKLVPVKTTFIHAIAVVISLLDILALLLIARLLRETKTGFWWVAFAGYIPFCFLSQLGTEGALSGFFLVLLMIATLHFAGSPDRRFALMFALAGSLAVLSRLDNIFIVGLVTVAVLLTGGATVRRLLVLASPVYVVLWGSYLASNLYWFGTLEPISGMLKAHTRGSGGSVLGLPHLGLLSLAIIIPSILVLARFRRDLFFRAVEVPYTLGVLIHAGYICSQLSFETRWSWYYTSWVLLASILLARVASVVLGAPRLQLARTILAYASVVFLLFLCYREGYRVYAVTNTQNDGTLYRDRIDKTGVKTVIAWDKPGRLAYFTDIHVISLDGLVGDLTFQHDLAREGIAAYDLQHDVDGFVGPPEPLDSGFANYCGTGLPATHFHCIPSGSDGQMITDRVEVFARLTGTSAGVIELPQDKLLWDVPDNFAIWALPSAKSTLRTGPPITADNPNGSAAAR